MAITVTKNSYLGYPDTLTIQVGSNSIEVELKDAKKLRDALVLMLGYSVY